MSTRPQWYHDLPTDSQERARQAMMAMEQRADTLQRQCQDLAPGTVEARMWGTQDLQLALRAQGIRDFLSALGFGSTPVEAEAEARAFARAEIKRLNRRHAHDYMMHIPDMHADGEIGRCRREIEQVAR